MPREQWKPSVLRALHGLAAYIEIEPESTLKKWATNSEQRKLVTHDGAFVDALYRTPDGKPNNGKASVFTETKENVKIPTNFEGQVPGRSQLDYLGWCPGGNCQGACLEEIGG